MYVCVRSANHSSLINPPSVTPVLDGCLSHKLSPQVWSQQGIRHTSRQGGPQWRSAQWHALARSRLFCQQLLSQLFIIVPAASSCHQGSEITRPRIWIWLRSAQRLWGLQCASRSMSITAKINQDQSRHWTHREGWEETTITTRSWGPFDDIQELPTFHGLRRSANMLQFQMLNKVVLPCRNM